MGWTDRSVKRRGVNQVSWRISASVKTRNKVGTADTPINIMLNQKNFACAEMSIQRVAYPPDQIAMAASRRLNAEEPGAERRQVAIEAVRETNAERIEMNA